jgi:two-component system OmpR family sensor kinase
MLRTLYSKLAAALLAVLSLLGVLFLWVNLTSTRRFLEEINQGLHRDLAAHLVQESLPLEDGEIQSEALEHIFHMLMVINPAIEVYLLDPAGSVLAYSAPEGSVVRSEISLAPIHAFLAGSRRLPVLGDDPKDPVGRKVFSAARVGPAGAPEGYLYVILGGEQYDSAVAMLRGSHMLRLGAAGSLAALIFALASGLLLFAVITRRVRRLADAVARFRDSGFEAPTGFDRSQRRHRGDEFDRLQETFGEMAEKMSDQLAELKKTDDLRRELVANVSHDLRTPITSLHGYLETLYVKADSLSAAERRQYLEIALKHSERLAQLVSELFELARLESCPIELEEEPFALTELVQDALQQIRLEAEAKHVELRAELPERSHRVRGDVGLIARVLDNLLDNAIRYTPSGGRITVGVDRRNGMLRVRVEDTGRGILPEHLPHIFERLFHQPAGERPEDEGIGLGLTIAHKALQLHGSELEVESEPGRGSCFAFELAADS